MRRWLSLALVVALVLAACGPDERPPTDWCYFYDFAYVLPDGINIVSGEQVIGHGLRTDDTGELIANFTEDFYIEPRYIRVTVLRIAPEEGDIGILANADVFGQPVFINQTMPTGLTEYVHQIEQDPGAPQVAGSAVNVTVQATGGTIAIARLEVGGIGASPYPTNPCGEETPVPATPTAVASETSTPGPTNTPTITITPSQTHTAEPTLPPYNCTSEFNFSTDDFDWEADIAAPVLPFANQINTFGTYGSGGWNGQSKQINASNNDLLGALSITWIYSGVPFEVSSVEWTYTKTSGTYLGSMSEQIVVDGYVARNVSSNSLSSGSYSTTLGSFWTLNTGEEVNYYHAYHRDWSSPYTSSGSFKLTSFKLNGTCIPPTFTPTPTNTASPVLTNTPTITNTINLTASATFTRTPLGGGTGTPSRTPTPTRTPIVLATWTPYPTNTPWPTLPPPTLDATPTIITATPETYTPIFTYTPLPSGTSGPPGGTPWGTPAAWGTPWGTPSVWGELPGYDDVYPWLATAAAEVNKLPGSLTGYVPNPNASSLFGYAKWMLSCTTAQELLGQTFSPIACHLTVGFILTVVLTSIYLSIKFIVLMLRIAAWIIRKIITFLPIVQFVTFIGTVLLPIFFTIFAWVIAPIVIALGILDLIGIDIDFDPIIGFLEDILSPILEPISKAIEIVVLLITVVVGVIIALVTWFLHVLALLAGLFTSFLTATPTPLPIPWLPKCTSAPTEHSFCAAYYIFDFTLFAPNTPGVLIVPILVLVIDLLIVFFFARYVMWFLRTGKEVTENG